MKLLDVVGGARKIIETIPFRDFLRKKLQKKVPSISLDF